MAKRKSRPNILFITCDQWRGDALGVAGNQVVKTPNVDRLAGEGTVFLRHFANAAPCAPARACIYTGLYQMNNRVCRNGTPLDNRHDNLARAARRAGYEPTLFGYTDVAPDPRMHDANDPALRGYEGILPGFSVGQLLPEHQRPWLAWLAAQGIDVSMGSPDIHRPADGSKTIDTSPPVYSAGQTETAFMVEAFMRWHGAQEDGWFAHLSFIRPHPPFAVPAPYNTMYEPAECGGFARAADAGCEADVHPFVAAELARTKTAKFLPGRKGKVRELSDADFRQIKALYYGMISEVDAQLGRLFDHLTATGQWDDTIVVLTSDHAELMGDHHLLGKGGYFDGSYHVPLIIRDPRRKPNRVGVTRFTEAVDLLPTLLDLMGLPAQPWLDGRSLVPFLDGKAPDGWRGEAHVEFDFRAGPGGSPKRMPSSQRAANLAVLRGERYKLVHFAAGPSLLFDLEDDPTETVDRSRDPNYRDILVDMLERLLAWRAVHLDQSLALGELSDEGPRGPFAPLPHP
ncbi:MAG: sulfatase-like hydrolase/transferase [Aliihoeflea sp.]